MMPATPSGGVIVRTLLGEKGVEHSLLCLRSLLRYSSDPIRLIIHEDGTLGTQSRQRLLSELPGSQIVTREEADDVALPVLRLLPRCRDMRTANPLFLKLIDLRLFEDASIFYVDSDVLFFRSFQGLFDCNHRFDSVFMRDPKNAYSVRPWQLRPFGSLSLAGFVNTGIVCCRSSFVDLDFVEYMLAKLVREPVFQKRACWAEQTCWALLARRSRSAILDPEMFTVAEPDSTPFSGRTVAIHFVSTYRSQLYRMLSNQTDGAREPLQAEFEPPSHCTAFHQFVSDWKARSRLRY
jgi:hypothetical protein